MHQSVLVFALLLSFYSRSQVPVSQEPHHPVVFADSRVRMLNVQLAPGDTTQFHIHSTPSVFVGLSTTHTGGQVLGLAPTDGIFKSGAVYFENLSAPHTRIHRVWNLDTMVFHVMDIELIGGKTGFKHPKLSGEYLSNGIDTPWVRSYNIDLPKDGNFGIRKADRDLILIALADANYDLLAGGSAMSGMIPAGKFFIINRGDELLIKNRDQHPARMALIEVEK